MMVFVQQITFENLLIQDLVVLQYLNMMQNQSTSTSNIKRLTSFNPSTHKHQSILRRIHLQQFVQVWNKQIACRTSCQFYQYRLQYIDCLKVMLVKKFDQLIRKSFVRKPETKAGYTLRYDEEGKSEDTKLIIEIEIVADTQVFKLAETSPRLIFDKIGKTKSCSLLILNSSLVDCLPEENILLHDFSSNINQLLLYFIVESHRIEPSLLKQLEESVQHLESFAYNQLERIKQTYLLRLQLNLIDQSKYAQESLRGLILSPNFCKYFNMVKVPNAKANRIKYICKQSIKLPKGKDYLTFQDRNFSLEGFRKHICYMLPFWFSLELILQTESQKPHCQVLIVPPMFSDSSRQKLTEKIITYIINLSQATNVKVLLNLMQKKHLCPFTPYELFINNKVKKIIHGSKPNQITKQSILKVPFLYVSAYPLYERFAHGNGLENIKRSQLWIPHVVQNLEYSYVIRFKSQVFIVIFREDTPYKQKKDLTIESRMRKLLIYQVYGVESKIPKQEIDVEFRKKIRQSQLQPLLNKISEHLIKAPEVLNRSQLQFLQNGKKYSFRITLPYMSCYGIYLSYLKQKLNYIHRKTSKKRHFTSRKMSHLDVDFIRQTEVVRFSSYVQDTNLEQYQYSFNEEDDMLFLFNYAAPRGNSDEPFGSCIYLLSIGLLNGNTKLQEISEYVYKSPISANSKKKSFYIYGVDPTQQPMGDKYKKQIKQLIQSLNQIFPSKQDQKLNKDSDAISSSSSFSGSENFYDENDVIPAQRKYKSLTVEFKYQIIGNQDFDQIQKYCETQVETTYCDYLIEGIIFRLKQSMDEYIQNLPLMNKKKKGLSFQDIGCVIEDSLSHLILLDRYSFMKKSLTIFNYQAVNMKINEHIYFEQILSQLAKNLIDIINLSNGSVLKKIEMVYYVLNANKKLIGYGNYHKLLTKLQYSPFVKQPSADIEVGIVLGSHISQLFEKIDEDSKKSTWTHGIKQYPDGKFFNSQTFVFKRNFLLKISVSKDGIRYFSYNVNRNINYSIIKNIEAAVEWNKERQLILESLKNLVTGKVVQIPIRIQNPSLLSIAEVWDPYREIQQQKQFEPKKNPKPLSLTSLFKLLVFDVTPPSEKGQYLAISHAESNRIYELLKNQKIDFSKYGQVPKQKRFSQFKCELSKLGFKVLSILRYTVLKQWKKKQDEQDI